MCDLDQPAPIEDPPTNDAPLSALEPFGLTGEHLQHAINRIGNIEAARVVIRDNIPIRRMGAEGRRCLSEALERADEWLAANPTHLV